MAVSREGLEDTGMAGAKKLGLQKDDVIESEGRRLLVEGAKVRGLIGDSNYVEVVLASPVDHRGKKQGARVSLAPDTKVTVVARSLPQ